MRYLSICSGIESATVAWHPLGWQPVAFAEVDPFPCAVLHHHYGSGRPLRMPDPDAPGLSLKERRRRHAAIKGVSYLPENPAVGCSSPTRHGVPNLGDFTQITRDDLRSDVDLLVGGTPCQDFSLAGLRAGLAGDRGNLTLEFLKLAQRLRPRWLVWENVPGVLSNNGGRDFGAILGGMAELRYGFAYRVLDAENGLLIAFGGNNQAGPIDVATACNAHGGPTGRLDFETETFIAFSSKDSGADALANVSPTLRAMNHDGSHANAGGQIAVAFDTTQITNADNRCNPQPGDPCHPIPAHGHAPAIAFNARQDPDIGGDVTHPLDTDGSTIGLMTGWRVRRLMPVECERLQGFSDGYTDVPYRRRNATPDGPRYKALGNSKATNCVEWLGRRIDMVDEIFGEQIAV